MSRIHSTTVYAFISSPESLKRIALEAVSLYESHEDFPLTLKLSDDFLQASSAASNFSPNIARLPYESSVSNPGVPFLSVEDVENSHVELSLFEDGACLWQATIEVSFEGASSETQDTEEQHTILSCAGDIDELTRFVASLSAAQAAAVGPWLVEHLQAARAMQVD